MQDNYSTVKENISRDPIIATVLSGLCMGLGQAYNGQRGKGYLFFVSQFLIFFIVWPILMRKFNLPFPKSKAEISYLSPPFLISSLLTGIIWLGNLSDAYQTAKRINQGEIMVSGYPGKSAVIFIVAVILGMIIIPVALILLMVFLGPVLGPALRCPLSNRP